MSEPAEIPALQVLLIGLAVVISAILKGLAGRLALPALVFYLLFGLLLRLLDARWGFMSEPIRAAFSLLANLGIVALLFDVGLTSNPRALAEKLPAASIIWVGNLLVAFGAGFATVYYLLGVDLLGGLFVGTAFTATSVGVAVTAWREAGAIDSPSGQLTLDVAELDDIGGVGLMALLFAIVPVLADGGNLWVPLAETFVEFLVSFLAFGAFCYLFSRHLEWRITAGAARLEPPPERMLTVAGIGFVIAALAGWLGFSLAIGALFAGLVFSHDRVAVRTERSFRDLYGFLTPFFFINIGFHIDPASLAEATQTGGSLVVAAVIGKLIGVGIPAWWVAGGSGAALIAVSMVPRAEIAMIVMHHGRALGEDVVSNHLYSGMVLVSAVTCLVTPLVLRPMLKRWPQKEQTPE